MTRIKTKTKSKGKKTADGKKKKNEQLMESSIFVCPCGKTELHHHEINRVSVETGDDVDTSLVINTFSEMRIKLQCHIGRTDDNNAKQMLAELSGFEHFMTIDSKELEQVFNRPPIDLSTMVTDHIFEFSPSTSTSHMSKTQGNVKPQRNSTYKKSTEKINHRMERLKQSAKNTSHKNDEKRKQLKKRMFVAQQSNFIEIREITVG